MQKEKEKEKKMYVVWSSLLSLVFGNHHCREVGKPECKKHLFVNKLPFVRGFYIL